MTGDADRLLLKRTKRKEGPTPDEHRLRLMQPQGQDSVVLEAVDSAHPDANRDPVLSKILSTLADGPMTTADVVKRTGLPRSTVNKKLEILERQGLIMNNSGRRTKEWELTSPAA
jgi:predicted Rossmann fold nucleotide-binding protein DprA/Smf involved in DNA uptake